MRVMSMEMMVVITTETVKVAAIRIIAVTTVIVITVKRITKLTSTIVRSRHHWATIKAHIDFSSLCLAIYVYKNGLGGSCSEWTREACLEAPISSKRPVDFSVAKPTDDSGFSIILTTSSSDPRLIYGDTTYIHACIDKYKHICTHRHIRTH